MSKKRLHIYVGLSGGVDSAVSAALLKKEGHEVTGVFIETWHPDFLECTWKEDRREAMRVAAHLDIPFVSLNLSDVYKKEVADYFIAEYKAGRTPNPDVMCNQSIKFGAFLRFAKDQGADGIATGHYAQIKNKTELHCGADSAKDQSYFLWTLPEEERAFVQFPIGGMQKSDVRAEASRLGLPNATRKDSQGICFLGAVDLRAFLSEFMPVESGDVVDTSGRSVGEHQGAQLYTKGERRGFRVRHTSENDAPLFVLSTDVSTNTITVGEAAQLPKEKELQLVSVRFDTDIKDGVAEAAVRYRGVRHACSLRRETAKCAIVFEEPVTVAAGQSVVVYRGERLVGGGVVA